MTREVRESGLRLETARLILRPVEPADAEPTTRLVSNDVSRNLSTWPSPLPLDHAKALVTASNASLARRDAVNLAITRKSDRALLGWISLARIADGEARLGYWLGRDFRGQGFVKEAVAAMIGPCAAYLGVERIIAHVLPANLASVAILKGAGFIFEGEEERFMEVRQTHELCLRFARPPICERGG